MSEHDLLMKIWDKVEYLNHETTAINVEITYIKWLIMGIFMALLGRLIWLYFEGKKINKRKK